MFSYNIFQREEGWYVVRVMNNQPFSDAASIIEIDGQLWWKTYVYNDKPYCTYFPTLNEACNALIKIDDV